MNERIRELAKEAGLKVNADGEISPAFFGSVDAGYRKFAELIVRECADIAKHHVMNISTYADADFVDEQIKEHFGVKE